MDEALSQKPEKYARSASRNRRTCPLVKKRFRRVRKKVEPQVTVLSIVGQPDDEVEWQFQTVSRCR